MEPLNPEEPVNETLKEALKKPYMKHQRNPK
jgi:hypothetical protein